RTNPDVPKHRGLTCFVVDMQQPGVTVRPIRQISGEAEFNEVFLTDVQVPDSDRIGPIDEGWRITMSTLMSERAHNADVAKKPRGFGPIGYAVRLWQQSPRTDLLLRDRLMQCWIDAESIRLTAIRGEQNANAHGAGPEASVLKLAIGELTQRILELCMDISGDAGLLVDDYTMHQPDVTGATNMGDGT